MIFQLFDDFHVFYDSHLRNLCPASGQRHAFRNREAPPKHPQAMRKAWKYGKMSPWADFRPHSPDYEFHIFDFYSKNAFTQNAFFLYKTYKDREKTL